jgi:hypothetical protein
MTPFTDLTPLKGWRDPNNYIRLHARGLITP